MSTITPAIAARKANRGVGMWQGVIPAEMLTRRGTISFEQIESPKELSSDLNVEVGSLSKATFGNATVRPYQDRYQGAWDEYVYHHPSGSIFHSIAWKRVIERVFRFEARYLFVEEHGNIRGVLPLFMVSNLLFGRSLISTPIAVYGGVCADDEPMSSQLRQAACQMAEQERVQYLELREQ